MIITGPPEYVKWRTALAKTETDDRPHTWGDFNAEGLAEASGRWQMHVSFVRTWLPKADVSLIKGEVSWDVLFDLCLYAFWTEYNPQAYDGVALAMWFHLHGGRGAGWDASYATRFENFYFGQP